MSGRNHLIEPDIEDMMHNIYTDLLKENCEMWNMRDLYWFRTGPSRGLVFRRSWTYVVGQLSSRTRHRVVAVAALDKRLSMV